MRNGTVAEVMDKTRGGGGGAQRGTSSGNVDARGANTTCRRCAVAAAAHPNQWWWHTLMVAIDIDTNVEELDPAGSAISAPSSRQA
ncbi:hypothetical protein D9619_010575 [Psilocybe cf. subviscida]|uniref:Uncharacterized protein n=1 Tax=Psilocybe cf. subviscida TaxID=2480587 RepID=A0A8H5ERX9_9AGAR|nr:hypothetical protein D9619_010575 [Psilocybe cf. subviscida]